MSKSEPLIDGEGEVRELTAADLKCFRPIGDVLSPSMLEKLKGRGAGKTSDP